MDIGDKLDYKKILGILFIILGLIFIIYPLFAAGTVSLIAGVCLISFGLASIFNGLSLWSLIANLSLVEVALGILSIILGFCFLINIGTLAIVISYSFYLVAFLLIFVGIAGLLAKGSEMSKWGSALILLLGIIFLFLAVLSITDPLIIAILIGVALIVRGVIFFTAGKVSDEIKNFG